VNLFRFFPAFLRARMRVELIKLGYNQKGQYLTILKKY